MKELSEAIINGNQEAFAYVYQLYSEGLFTLAYRYLKNTELAENAVQHSFVKLWEKRSEIVSTMNLQNFLFTITKNYVINQIRNETRALMKNYEIVQEQAPYGEDEVINAIDNKANLEKLNTAICNLPEPHQQIVNLKRNGLTNNEIAEKLGLSINTIKAYYTQSIKALRKYLLTILLFIYILWS